MPILRSLKGAWDVMNGRAEGLKELDLSVSGFWRSFGAVLLVVPFALLDFPVEQQMMQEGEDFRPLTGAGVALRLAELAADWIAFPVVFALLAPSVGLAERYVPLIVARNWAGVILAVFFGVVALPMAAGLVSPDAFALMLLVLFGIALRFAYLVVRTALMAPLVVALPVVVLDVLLSLLVGVAFGHLQ